MPESSHKKGEEYQRNVRHLLTKTRLLGLESELFGDAYDVTRKACTVGGVAFDFSLRLGQGEVARHVVYVECKFRQEKTANLNGEFRNFLKRSYDALLAAEEDEGRDRRLPLRVEHPARRLAPVRAGQGGLLP